MRKELVVAVLLAAVGIATQNAHSQGGPVPNYPQRPIRLVVGFPPGGATDILARILQQYMPEQIGQPVVVDTAGLAITMATRFGLAGLTGFKFLGDICLKSPCSLKL